jgi:hypothetical protein
MPTDGSRDAWPELPLAAWQDTYATLHRWIQIVGKVRLAKTPWVNHSWHATLYVTARGLTTSLIPYDNRAFEIEFDFIDHALVIRSSDGATRRRPLRAQSVADFHADFLAQLAELDLGVAIHGRPNEMPDATPFAQDRAHCAYDPEYAQRFWRVLLQVDRVLKHFRTGFLGKATPVHLFWGGLDLAVTRFSGRSAPKHPGGYPNMPDSITREAYSHEVSSAGFWAGGGVVDYPAFYSYAYPAPEGYGASKVAPVEAFYLESAGEFLLPYDAVRTRDEPEAALLQFLQSTYDAAADRGKWDRAALDAELGQPLVVPQRG